jgi:hypothetical protein
MVPPGERGQAHGGIRHLLEHLDVDLEAIHLLVALAEDPQIDGMARYYAGRALGNIGRHQTAANLMLSLVQAPDVQGCVHRMAPSATVNMGYQDEAIELVLDFPRNPQVSEEMLSWPNNPSVRRLATQSQ